MITRLTLLAAIGAAMAILAAMPAHALSNRVLVSAKSGADNPGCGASATPCRTFQFAHNETNPGGQISVLDPGEYGPVHITKSISIVNDGAGTASVQQPGSFLSGVKIQAAADHKIFLRGLAVDGLGTGGYGFTILSADSVNIVNCVAKNFLAHGIDAAPLDGTVSLFVTDTLVADNHGSGISIGADSGTGSVKALLDRVTAVNNFGGVYVYGPNTTGRLDVTAVDSVVVHHTDHGQPTGRGFSAETGALANVSLILDGVTSSGNNVGLFALWIGGPPQGKPDVRITRSLFTQNTWGIYTSTTMPITSTGDNQIRGNTTNIEGNIATVTTQ